MVLRLQGFRISPVDSHPKTKPAFSATPRWLKNFFTLSTYSPRKTNPQHFELPFYYEYVGNSFTPENRIVDTLKLGNK
ncbi:hypothetical protein BH23PAT2_BH23PAT2_02340 [soil metagenome]